MLNYDNYISNLSAEEIQNAANQYLGENLVQVILFPESEKNE